MHWGVECRSISALTLSDENSCDVPNARSRVECSITVTDQLRRHCKNKGMHRTGSPKVNVYANRARQALGVSTSFTWGETLFDCLSKYRLYDTSRDNIQH